MVGFRSLLKAERLVMVLCVLLCCCRQGTGKKAAAESAGAEYVPEAPVYADTAVWFVRDRGGEADIFYITSTETGDYTAADGLPCHYADTQADSLRQPLTEEMAGVDALVSGNLNFYAPYYRQCSLQSFTTDSLQRARLQLPLTDVQRAFTHYLTHVNSGRPFVLMGFSQGAMLLLQLLQEMDEGAMARMVAAYVIGAVVPTDMRHPHIVAARGPDDTGVTICYNSVRDVRCALPGWERSRVGINPVSWRTDGQAATLVTEPSPLLPESGQKRDTLCVRLDTASGLLLVDGYTATDYILPLIGREGNYHSREIWLYRRQLRENVALRVQSFMR